MGRGLSKFIVIDVPTVFYIAGIDYGLCRTFTEHAENCESRPCDECETIGKELRLYLINYCQPSYKTHLCNYLVNLEKVYRFAKLVVEANSLAVVGDD